MKSVIRKKALLMMLLAIVLICIPQITYADDVDGETEVTVFDVTDELNNIDTVGSNATSHNKIYYNDKQILDRIGSEELSGEIALTSMALSEAAYNLDQIQKLCADMGYTKLLTSKHYTQESTYSDCDVVAYSINEKYVRYNGEVYRILLVPIRGTKGSEWYSDFHLGGGQEHQGFSRAAQEVKDYIKSYLESPSLQPDHTVLWLTGHSRGAAVANMIAGKLSTPSIDGDSDDTEWGELIPAENVIAYTFACPNVSTFADDTLKNIYNFNNRGDLIPVLPFESWDYKRYGQTKELDLLDLDNVKNRYKQVFGKESSLNMNTDKLQNLILSLAPNKEAYISDEVQLGLDIVALALKATDTTIQTSPLELLEILKAHQKSTGIEVIDDANLGVQIGVEIVFSRKLTKAFLAKLAGTTTASAIFQLFQSEKQEYEYVEQLLEEAIEETKDMVDEDYGDDEHHQKYLEWLNWKRDNEGLIAVTEVYTDIRIDKIADIRSAKNSCKEHNAAFNSLADFVFKALDIFFDNDASLENVLKYKDSVIEGHEPSTYRLWINSMYYGYQGWCGFNDISKVNWDRPTQKSYIGDYCFDNCDNIEYVIVPEGLQLIGSNAFSYCDGLKSVTIPDNVSIGTAAFMNCTALTEIDFAGSGITIGDGAFSYCTALETLIIPDDIARVGKVSFANCTSLNNLTAPYDYEIYASQTAFEGSINIENLTITKGKDGEYYEDEKCVIWPKNVTHITIAEGVKSLGTYMIGDYGGLEEIELPASLERANYDAFGSGTNRPKDLKKVTYNGDIDSWCNIDFRNDNANPISCGNGVFFIGDKELTHAVIPSSVTEIKPYTFYSCTSLQDVTIPSSVIKIDHDSFYGCNAITDVYYEGSENEWKGISIGSNNDSLTNATIHYGRVDVTGVTLDCDDLSLDEGKSFTLVATVEPENASNKTVEWTSENPSIASVDENGLVLGVKEGKTTVTAKAVGTEISATCTVSVTHKHILEKIEAKATSCAEAGNSEYWTCSTCGEFFADSEGQTEIKENDWIIPALPHTLTEHKAVTPGCETEGSEAYYDCSVCHKYFSDENGVNEIEENSWIVSPIGHDWSDDWHTVEGKDSTCIEEGQEYDLCKNDNTHVRYRDKKLSNHTLTKTEASTATCEQDGNIEYWTCSVCHKYFSDEDGTVEIEEKDTVIGKTAHIYGSWQTTTAATELAAGKKTRTCTVCGITETASIAMLKPTLKAVKILEPKAAKKSATIKWKKVSKADQKKIAKIQIQYSTDKSFKKGVKTVYGKKSATSKKITKLASKKTYYVRVRAYKKSGGKVHVSKWSAVKKVKVK